MNFALFFDSHAHYDDRTFDNDRDELLTRLFKEKIVSGIINVGCNLTSSQKSIELSQKYPLIWASVGVHPTELKNLQDDYLHILENYLKNPKVVAVGEIGLDYHYKPYDKDGQIKIFEEQLTLAKNLDMPVIVHTRESDEDALELLKKYQPKGVVHCFSASLDFAREIINLGMYIGLGGAVTFKDNPAAAAKNVPLERILLETDCPYMTPIPFRGKRNDSSLIKYVVEKISDERNISADKIINITKENTLNLFSKIKGINN